MFRGNVYLVQCELCCPQYYCWNTVDGTHWNYGDCLPSNRLVFHYLSCIMWWGGKIFKGQVNVTHLLHGIDRYFLGECHQDFDVIWSDFLSKVVVFNPFNTVFVPGLKAVISFKPGGWFSGTDDLHTVEGFIIDKSVELVYLKGMFTSLKIQFWN